MAITYQIRKATVAAAVDGNSVDISYQLILNTDGVISFPTVANTVASDDTATYDSVLTLNGITGGTLVDA